MNSLNKFSRNARLSLAPMLDLTDRHFRYFCRVLSRNIFLYTEMVSTGAIIYGSGDYLRFDPSEHPVALQLGGSNPQDLAKAAKAGALRGYDEINLNAGCPSSRVQSGSFGAVLMQNFDVLSDAVKALKDAVDIPVTVKTRLGVNDLRGRDFTHKLVETIRDSGASGVILHARDALLGISPKDNRVKPPLDYEAVYEIKKDFPDLFVGINGNITNLSDALKHLEHVDGVMMGRALYQNPYLLAEADHLIYGEPDNFRSRKDIIRAMYPYIEKELSEGELLKHVTRHFIGMFQGCPNAKAFRTYMAQHQQLPGAGIETIESALALVSEEIPSESAE